MSKLKRIRTRINKENLEKAQKEGHITEEQAQKVIDTDGLYNPYTDTYINPDILPEISVTAKAPERTWTSEWSYNDPEFRLAREHRNIAAQEVAKSTRDKMNQVGNAIGKTIIEATSFTPLWFAAPIAKAGIATSEGDYSGAAKEAAVGLLAPYAIGKGLEKGYSAYQAYRGWQNGLKEAVAHAFSQSGQPVRTSSSLTGREFWIERPAAKISEAERLGIPKGETVPYTRDENIAFRNQINEFANKYGYEPIGEEVTDPEVLERYARSMISKHNSFYRGIHMPYNEDDIAIIHKVLGASPTKEQVLQYVATHPRSKQDPMFISPRSNAGIYGANGKIAIISRPYKLGPDRTKWFTEGDYPIYQAPGLKQYQLPENVIADPWTTPSFPEKRPSVGGGYRYYDFDPTDKEFYDLVKHLYEVRPFDAPSELTTRSPMIFRGWANGELPDLSRNYGRHPWQEVVFRKQGGKLNYLNYIK